MGRNYPGSVVQIVALCFHEVLRVGFGLPHIARGASPKLTAHALPGLEQEHLRTAARCRKAFHQRCSPCGSAY